MGVSTDAIFAYGVNLGEEMPPGMTTEQWDDITDVWGDDEIAERGFEVIYHCSGEYPMYFLAVPGTQLTAWRGSPKTVDSLSIESDPLAQFINAMKGLEVDVSEAGWHIFSMWS